MLTSLIHLKAFIISSVLLALAAADTCSDCTAVVSTIAARLSSEESVTAQAVVIPLNQTRPKQRGVYTYHGHSSTSMCKVLVPKLVISRITYVSQMNSFNANIFYTKLSLFPGYAGGWTLPEHRGPSSVRGRPSRILQNMRQCKHL